MSDGSAPLLPYRRPACSVQVSAGRLDSSSRSSARRSRLRRYVIVDVHRPNGPREGTLRHSRRHGSPPPVVSEAADGDRRPATRHGRAVGGRWRRSPMPVRANGPSTRDLRHSLQPAWAPTLRRYDARRCVMTRVLVVHHDLDLAGQEVDSLRRLGYDVIRVRRTDPQSVPRPRGPRVRSRRAGRRARVRRLGER